MSLHSNLKQIAVCLMVTIFSCGCTPQITLDEPPALQEMPVNSDYVATEVTTVPTTATTTVTTTTAPPPKAFMIYNVPFQTQIGVLPTGCELISAMMLLQYHKRDVSIDDIISHTLQFYPERKNGRVYAPYPSEAFIGTPDDPTGFGCFPPVVADMMSNFLPSYLEAVDTSGTELSDLAETYVANDYPVLIWATINMVESFKELGWYLIEDNKNYTEEFYQFPAMEHCLVLIGYDEEYYYFNDPMQETSPTKYEKELVEKRFAELDKMSLVVYPKK